MLPLLWLAAAAQGFQAGAAQVDITPTSFPVIVNCGFAERTANQVTSPLFVKALVLAQGERRIALAVADSCMMPRPLLDRAKAAAALRTGIPADRILISATHSHTTPSVHACLGSDEQPGYGDFLVARLVEAIAQAKANLAPARLGAASVDVPTHTHSRRFLYRADRALTDPFGAKNVFANMHPGYENANAVGPSGPVDSGLTILSVQTRAGQPLAVFANYSMHYFGSSGLSADYAGVFSAQLRARLSAPASFVPIFSQGTSGDLHWMDYSKPKVDLTIDQYTKGLVDAAMKALATIRYQNTGALAMEQTTLTADWRRPDAARLAWARERVAGLNGSKPKSQPDIYAREAVFLSEKPRAELILQAIRVGELAITAVPNEVFAITGLKLKQRSPLALTMNVELANGAEGYIPPPEQHALGGYTTWPARTAGLAPDTEPRVVEAILGLLERATGARRRAEKRTSTNHYWSFDELDALPLKIDGKHALGVEGIRGRAAYLLNARPVFPAVAGDHTLLMWLWSANTRRWEHRAAVCAKGQSCPPLFPEPFEGKIDEVRLIRKALTPDQIQAAANALAASPKVRAGR